MTEVLDKPKVKKADFFDLKVAPEREPVSTEEWKQGEWWQRIQRAKARGSFTHEDRLMATHWNSCAIGEAFGFSGNSRVCAIEELRKLSSEEYLEVTTIGGGRGFDRAVPDNNFEKAELHLQQAYGLAKKLGRRK